MRTSRMSRISTAGFVAAAVALAAVAAHTADAQTKKKSGSTSSRSTSSSKSTKAKAASGRLPKHFAQVGLKDEQREEIYKIQATYKKEIDDLEKQLAALREEMDDDIEDVLTSTQKRKLSSLRRGTTTASTKSSSSKSGSSKSSSSKSSSSKSKSSSSKKK